MKYKKDNKGKAVLWSSYLSVPSSGEGNTGAGEITATDSHSLQYFSQPIMNCSQSGYEDPIYREWFLLKKPAIPIKDISADLSNAPQSVHRLETLNLAVCANQMKASSWQLLDSHTYN